MIRFFCFSMVSVALWAGVSFSAHAGEVPISKYDQIKGDQIFKLYVTGVESGLSWANADLMRAGKSPLYCQPQGMRTTTEQTLELLEGEIQTTLKDPTYLGQNPEMQDRVTVPFVLFNALKRRYPCSAPSSTQVQQPAPVIQAVIPTAPLYRPQPLPAMPAVPFPSAPGRTTTICRTLSNGTVFCD